MRMNGQHDNISRTLVEIKCKIAMQPSKQKPRTLTVHVKNGIKSAATRDK